MSTSMEGLHGHHAARTCRSAAERTQHIMKAKAAAKKASYHAPPTPINQADLRNQFRRRDTERQQQVSPRTPHATGHHKWLTP